MNERIKELAEQAGNHADTYDDANGPFWFQMYNEKFAELIVQECAKSLWTEECHNSDLALEEFEKEPFSEREKGMIRMRSITNYGMGLFMIVAGFVFMFPTKYTIKYIELYDPVLIKIC